MVDPRKTPRRADWKRSGEGTSRIKNSRATTQLFPFTFGDVECSESGLPSYSGITSQLNQVNRAKKAILAIFLAKLDIYIG